MSLPNQYYGDPWLEHAADVVRSTYGHILQPRRKSKDLSKFGRTEQGQTSLTPVETTKTGIFNETYVFDNLIDTISSTDAGDTELLVVEGHTIDTTTGLITVRHD